MNEKPNRNDDEAVDHATVKKERIARLRKRVKALRLARQTLKREPITAKKFQSAVWVVLDNARRLGAWGRSVEVAYLRMKQLERQRARFTILRFFTAIYDYEAAARYVPPRITHRCNLLTLALVMDTWLALEDYGHALGMVEFVQRGANEATNSWMRAGLLDQLADLNARLGRWSEAAALWREVPIDSYRPEIALLLQVQASVAKALEAVQFGLLKVVELRIQTNTESKPEFTEDERTRWNSTEMELNRMQKHLLQVLPPNEWKWFGLSKKGYKHEGLGDIPDGH